MIYNPNPTDVWVDTIHFVGDELRVLQEAGPAVDHISDFTFTAANVEAFKITKETMVGLPVTFAGLRNNPLGNASLNIGNLGTNGQDGVFVANLGSSGQDGVSIALGKPQSLTEVWSRSAITATKAASSLKSTS